MKERPILFNAEMVRAIYDGKKTQTRRPLSEKQTPHLAKNQCDDFPDMKYISIVQGGRWGFGAFGATEEDCAQELLNLGGCPFGRKGDRLWVRETHTVLKEAVTNRDIVAYKATEQASKAYDAKWTPSIHMKREHCRFVLEIQNVRVQRVNDISENDALCEGFSGHSPEPVEEGGTTYCWKGRSSAPSSRAHFAAVWNSIYDNWHDNPWVWVLDFTVVRGEK